MKTSTPVSLQMREIPHTAAKAEQDHQWGTLSPLSHSTVVGKHIWFVNAHLPKRLGSRGIDVRVQAFLLISLQLQMGFLRSPGVNAGFEALLVW